MQKVRSDRNGFTLLELVLVLVLMGFIAGMTAPFLISTVERIQLQSVTRKINAALKLARNTAVSKKKRFSFHADIDENRYWLGTSDSEEKQIERTIEGDARISQYSNKGTPVSAGVFSIEFYPQGNASGGSIRIEPKKTEDSDSVYVITVDPITGSSRIEQIEPKEK